LEELGYEVQWMVLNSKFFGVPQNRERVLIIGNIRGTCRPEILPFREVNESTNKYIKQLNNPTHSNNRLYGEDGISPALNTAQGGNRQPKIVNPLKGKSDYGWHFEQNVYSEESICRSIKSGEGSGNKPKIMVDRNKCNCNQGGTCEVCCVGCGNYKDECDCEPEFKIRRLTPVECCRLQGFPDDWNEWGIDEKGEKVKMSDTQRYKQMGNAVTTKVIQAVGTKLCDALRGVDAE